MRSAQFTFIAVGVAWLCASPAAAQFSLALDGSRGVAPSMMVQRADVQAELGLLPAQIHALRRLDEATREKRLAEFRELSQVDPAVRDKKRTELVRKTSEEQLKALAGILDEKQMHRLKEVTWQVAGSQALKNEEVQTKLNLSEKQKDRIQVIMKAAIAEMATLFQQDREGIAAAGDKADKIRFKALDDTVAVLTPEQQKQFKEMKGQPFQFKRVPTLSKLMDPVWTKGDVAKPGDDPNDLQWVTERSESWAPAPEERKMDLIGWADGLIPALRLAKQHQRPIFIFTLDGILGQGRC